MKSDKSTEGNLAEGGTSAVHGPTGRTASDLHEVIMNIPAYPLASSDWRKFEDASDEVLRAYNIGHRDARHAAAELVLAASPSAPAGKPVAFAYALDDGETLRMTVDQQEASTAADNGWKVTPLFAAPPTSLLREVMEGMDNFRDAVLNSRDALEESTLNNDQANAVLAQFDNDCGPVLERMRAAAPVDLTSNLHPVMADAIAPFLSPPKRPAANLADDFVEHSHPAYGAGYFCTPDVLVKLCEQLGEQG